MGEQNALAGFYVVSDSPANSQISLNIRHNSCGNFFARIICAIGIPKLIGVTEAEYQHIILLEQIVGFLVYPLYISIRSPANFQLIIYKIGYTHTVNARGRNYRSIPVDLIQAYYIPVS